MKTKNTILILGIIFAIVLLMNGIYAKDYFKICLKEGETIEYSKCRPNMEDRTCSNDHCGSCAYMGTKGFLCPDTSNPTYCDRHGLTCSYLGEGGSLDIIPPVITLNNPVEGNIYSEKKVLINASANESARFRYQDNTRPGTWRNLCTNSLTKNCLKETIFKEGLNNITIKATDASNNDGFYEVSFTVDSVSPRIYRTEPRNGFATGDFEVQFKENNPERLTLHYGNDEKNLDIEDDCDLINGKHYCETSLGYADLDEYNGQEMEYYFEVEDIAGNTYASRPIELDVDTEPPVINNPDGFWTQGEGRYARYISFSLEITEANLYRATYSYNYNERNYERTLCTRLTNGVCVKKQSFARGDYDLSIQIYDKAGHSIAIPASFDIDY